MKKRFIAVSFIFWWSIMFPIINFSEKELTYINDNSIEFKSLISEILH